MEKQILVNLSNKIDENFLIYIDDEFYGGMKQRCLLNGIGLIGVTEFDYTYTERSMGKKNIFNLNISAIDLLEDERFEKIEQIDNLNYLLDF